MPRHVSRRSICRSAILFATFAALAACALPGHTQHADRVGVYAMGTPATAELRVVALPGRPGEYRVEVQAGGDPDDGAATGADCYAVAEGRLQGQAISARFVPFESIDAGFDAAELAAKPRNLELTFEDDHVQLAGDFEHCALRTRMAGRYRLTAKPELMRDCPPLPRACWNRD
jgi:hypothetical protein